MVELNIEDVKELKRVTQMETEGVLDKDGVKAFVEAGFWEAPVNIYGQGQKPSFPMTRNLWRPQAGGCLDGKQHLLIGDMVGAAGVKKIVDSLGAPAAKTKAKKEDGGKEKPKQAPLNISLL